MTLLLAISMNQFVCMKHTKNEILKSVSNMKKETQKPIYLKIMRMNRVMMKI